MQFENRIVGTDNLKASQLFTMMNPSNWKLHTGVQTGLLKSSLSDIGWVGSVMVNKRSSPEFGEETGKPRIVNGHLRVKTSRALNPDMLVPVEYVDLSPEEEKFILATFDPLSGLADSDSEIFLELIKSIESEEPDVVAGLAAIAKEFDLESVPESTYTPSSSPAYSESAGGYPDLQSSEKAAGDIPASRVKMVQLFLDTDTHPEFLEICARLEARFGTDNLTDTVFEAVKFADAADVEDE